MPIISASADRSWCTAPTSPAFRLAAGLAYARSKQPLPLAAGIKYQFSIIASGPSRLTISLNESRTSVEVRPLLDGGLLVLMLGRKHLAYGKEEVRSSLRRSNILPRVCQRASHRRQLYRSLTPDGCGRCRIGCLSVSLFRQQASDSSWTAARHF